MMVQANQKLTKLCLCTSSVTTANIVRTTTSKAWLMDQSSPTTAAVTPARPKSLRTSLTLFKVWSCTSRVSSLTPDWTLIKLKQHSEHHKAMLTA